MPVLNVTLMEGYDEATRERLCRTLTSAVRSVIDAPLDGITVVVNEVKPANYMRGGVRRRPGVPRRRASDLVRDFLSAMEQRDLAAARSFLADGFTMTFPGGACFRHLEELVAFAGSRYRRIAKTYERIDELLSGEDTLVFCSGTLSGTWLDGKSFEGIRFLDRVVVRDGALVEQQVWNDLAEHRPIGTGA